MGLIGWIKSKFRRKPDPPMISFVWLLDEPRNLDAPTVQRIVEQALGITFPPSSDDAQQFVVGEVPAFMVKLEEVMLLVNCFPAPYMTDAERVASQLKEKRLQQIAREHRAWVSVDLMGEYDEEQRNRAWPMIGKIAAGLADDRCMAILIPATDQCIPYATELLDQLRQENPLESLSWQVAPVISIDGEDPRMKAAVEEARKRWPEFVAAFRNPGPDQENFSVKLPITDSRNTEFIWVEVIDITDDEVAGDLANEPVDLRFLRLGSRVRGRVADLNDWAYLDGGEMVGGFTTQVLMGQP